MFLYRRGGGVLSQRLYSDQPSEQGCSASVVPTRCRQSVGIPDVGKARRQYSSVGMMFRLLPSHRDDKVRFLHTIMLTSNLASRRIHGRRWMQLIIRQCSMVLRPEIGSPDTYQREEKEKGRAESESALSLSLCPPTDGPGEHETNNVTTTRTQLRQRFTSWALIPRLRPHFTSSSLPTPEAGPHFTLDEFFGS